MDLPIILISDFEEDPPITTRYIHHDNYLNLGIIRCKINGLREHPGRGFLDENVVPTQFKECDPEFLDLFWTCAANLCDYFADFLSSDTVIMQSVWFDMLDTLKQVAVHPHRFWLPAKPSCQHSQDVLAKYRYLQLLIRGLIVPWNSALFDPITCPTHMLHEGSNITLGSGKSGLKSWQQFLYQGSPGFTVPEIERVYTTAGQSTPYPTGFEVQIPRGGLALIDKHTKRLRALAERSSEGQSDVHTEDTTPVDLNRKTLDLKRVSTFTTISGRQAYTKPMYPIPDSEEAPRRPTDLLDPSFELSEPCLESINECVGFHKDGGLFRHTDELGNEDKFYMLSYGPMNTMPNRRSSQSKVDPRAYFTMFNDWTTIV